MKLNNYFHKVCVGLAAVGLLVPNPGLASGAEKSQTAKQASPSIIDVLLADRGVLQGQVISPEGQVLANVPVALHQGQNEIAKTTTDKNGRFALSGLKGGVYVVSTDGAAGVVRAWSPRTAPPSSVDAVLLVPQTETARAQLLENGIMTNPRIGALLVGGFAAAVLVVAIDHNSAS